MKFFRFVLPFLFYRNWYNGQWELSKHRLLIFSVAVAIVCLGVLTAYIMQMPVIYSAGT